MFRACNNRGFHMTFENGWTVSVQWGVGNYCHNRSLHLMDNGKEQESLTAEVMAWHKTTDTPYIVDRRMIDEDIEYKEVIKGWLDPNDVLEFMNEVSRLPKP